MSKPEALKDESSGRDLRFPSIPGSHVQTPLGSAYLVEPGTVNGQVGRGSVPVSGRRDPRFFRIVQETMADRFRHYYLALERSPGDLRALQPCFLYMQNVTEGVRIRPVRFLGGLVPGLRRMRTLMVGSPVGEGAFVAHPEDGPWCARALGAALPELSRRVGASLAVLKEFPAELRPSLEPLLGYGFCRIPSMPHVRLDLDFKNFEEFMARSLSKSTRKGLRRKFRDTQAKAQISMEVTSDVSAQVGELYPLYLQVFERSEMRFEKLTPEFLGRLGRELPERTRYFIWRREGRAIAFSLCTLHGDALWDEYLGMDYGVAFDLNLYYVTLRDVLDWCCREGLSRYYSTALGYEPKLRLKFSLSPLDLYVRHVNPVLNFFFGRFGRGLSPASGDPLLRQFPNWGEL